MDEEPNDAELKRAVQDVLQAEQRLRELAEKWRKRRGSKNCHSNSKRWRRKCARLSEEHKHDNTLGN